MGSRRGRSDSFLGLGVTAFPWARLPGGLPLRPGVLQHYRHLCKMHLLMVCTFIKSLLRRYSACDYPVDLPL